MSVSPEHFAGFLERIGHRVRQSGGLYWFNSQRGVYSSFPFHRSIDAHEVQIPEILRRDGLIARFGCPAGQGIDSFRILCSRRDYDFPALRSRTRTQVRRGLEACRVERVDFSTLQQQAIPLNADTLIRQGRRVPGNLAAYWTRYYDAAATTEGAEAWASFVGNELAAYLISFTMDDVANLVIVRSSLKHLESFPNNALLFQFLYERLRTGDISQVCYGYESIQAELQSLDQFKTGMGFEKVPTCQRIEVNGWLKPLLNRYTGPLAARILSTVGDAENAAKLRGILTWYQSQPALVANTEVQRAA